MKIAFLSFYSGIVERGVEIWVKELAKRLSKNHEIFVFQAGKQIEDNFIRHTPIDVDWNTRSIKTITRRLYLDYYSRKIYSFTRKALTEIDKEDVDLLIPTNGGWQTMLSRIYTKLKNKKLIVVGHSGIGWDDFINLIIRPDVFICLTNYQKNWAKKIAFGVKIAMIPDGVDLKFFTPTGKKVFCNLPKPIILLVSALSESKRVSLAIKAVSKLKKGSLVILGGGTLMEKQQISELGNRLLRNRFLLTELPHQEIAPWYRAADVVTFPAGRREAFGMVLLEAMACNKPIVTNNDPAKREIVGEGGYFCNPNNINEYASMLLKALNHNFKDLPRQQAKKFSWEIIVAQYEELLRNL